MTYKDGACSAASPGQVAAVKRLESRDAFHGWTPQDMIATKVGAVFHGGSPSSSAWENIFLAAVSLNHVPYPRPFLAASYSRPRSKRPSSSRGGPIGPCSFSQTRANNLRACGEVRKLTNKTPWRAAASSEIF